MNAASPRPGQDAPTRSNEVRRNVDTGFVWFCIMTAFVSVAILAVLLTAIVFQGIPQLDFGFLTSPPSPDTEVAGIYPALFGTTLSP